MTPIDEQVRQVAYLLRGGSETLHLLAGVTAPAPADWLRLDQLLRDTHRTFGADDVSASDAQLLLWLEGLTPQALTGEPRRQRLLDRALSCGLRTNGFEWVLAACDRLGFAAAFGSVDPHDPGHEVDLRMKYVRLLKRRGAYGDALQVLGAIASSLRARSGAESELDIAAVLYSVAKSLGSYQNRSGQSRLLCAAVSKRILGAMRHDGLGQQQFLRAGFGDEAPTTAWRAEQLWAKVADYSARQRLSADGDTAAATPKISRAALLRWWDTAIRFEDRHGIKAGRSRFARQAALFALEAGDARHEALRAFERLLLGLMTDNPLDQRGVAIRALQAAQMCAEIQAWGKAREYAELSLGAARIAADWPVLARALLLQSTLVIAGQQGSAERWGEALYLTQRASEAMTRLREPPLPLLFDNCVVEARIALSMGDHGLARERISQAIEHVARMRDALLQEDWTGGRPGSPAWLHDVAKLLTPRQRATMQAELVIDWQRLLRAQDKLVELLASAHEIENYLGVVAISAAREKLIRSGLAHDVANVVSRHMASLVVGSARQLDGARVVLASEVTRTQQQIEDEIRRHVTSGADTRVSAASIPGRFLSVSQLVAIDDRQLELLRTFAPRLTHPVVTTAEDFELRCDEKLFRILYFQFLLNAAQELVTAAQPRIEVAVLWSEADGAGLVEVSDSAGRVEQLRAVVQRLQEDTSHADSGRGWGMREALRFFAEAWHCPPPHIDGTEGERTVLQLRFPHGRGVNRARAANLRVAT